MSKKSKVTAKRTRSRRPSPAICSALSREEWLAQWVGQWRKRGFGDDEYARMSAESWLDSNPDDITQNAGEVADDIFEEEMEQARQSM